MASDVVILAHLNQRLRRALQAASAAQIAHGEEAYLNELRVLHQTTQETVHLVEQLFASLGTTP